MSERIVTNENAGELTAMKSVGQPLNNSVSASGSDPGTMITRDVRDRLVRLAYRFLWNRDDAEDAVQEALTSSLEHRESLRSTDKWLSWLSSIVIRKCYELGRRKKTRAQQHARLPMATESRSEGSTDLLGIDHEAVRQKLMKLPRRQREVIILRYLELMSYEQISDILVVSPSTVRVHARNGLESLRIMLKD